MGADATLIRLREVSFRYDSGRLVLDGLNAELRAGERVGLTGPNGSGKTTLLHLLVGLLRPQGGEVEIFGRPRRREGDFIEVRRKVGLLFQDPEDQLFCPTVAEDVAFGPLNLGRSREQARATVSETLAELGLREYEDRLTHRLSFGEKRLVSLATVLAMKPDVLLLDEPTAGLDEDTCERITELLAHLDQAMIIASHDEQLLKRLTSSRIVLRNGRRITSRT